MPPTQWGLTGDSAGPHGGPEAAPLTQQALMGNLNPCSPAWWGLMRMGPARSGSHPMRVILAGFGFQGT